MENQVLRRVKMKTLVTNCYDCPLRECPGNGYSDTCWVSGVIVKNGEPVDGDCSLDKNDFVLKKK